MKVSDLNDARLVRQALDACALTLDGRAAAATTARRKRAVFYNALRYAVELDLLPANPIDKIQWTAPPVAQAVDRRVVANPAQVAALLDAVGKLNGIGPRLVAFFACLYYAALRPSEAAALRKQDCVLPDEGWGRLELSRTAPHAGSAWTDDQSTREERGLKRRAKNASRSVPIPPQLVALLRKHLDEFGTAPDGRLFRGMSDGPLAETRYGAVWRRARKLALTPEQFESKLAARPYDLRHAGVSLWLNAGHRHRRSPRVPATASPCFSGSTRPASTARMSRSTRGSPTRCPNRCGEFPLRSGAPCRVRVVGHTARAPQAARVLRKR